MEEIYTFGGNPLDRVSERRKDTVWIDGLLKAPETLILPFRELKPLVRSVSEPALDWRPVAPWRAAIDDGATLVLLGIRPNGAACFAIDASAHQPEGASGDNETFDVRALAPLIAPGEAAVVAEARSVLDWHARHRFCAQCGTPSNVASGGWVRRCPNCRAHHFPRTDPVVIMLTVDGDHCLLGRNRRRAGSRFSCLAGFMEPGETLEEAVRRETLEEAGIRVGRVRYLASQPWPFPSTLMMGFLAEAVSREITVDPDELAEARWFHRDEARQMIARARDDKDDPEGGPSLPPPLAIAHQIIRRWSHGLDKV